MFSSGNTTERQRMGRLQCAGETVVDLYAGIGYYTLPFLCKAGKTAGADAVVYCCTAGGTMLSTLYYAQNTMLPTA